MRVARVIGRFGRVLITAGVIILLFVAYQLWGTGLHTADAQSSLIDDFEAALDANTGDRPTTTTAAPDTTATTGTPGTTVPADTEEPQVVPPAPPEGQGVGVIDIPAIGVHYAFLEGVDLSVLKDGPGHYMGTPLPGQPGNAAIAGHRTTYGAPFNRLDEMKSGDEIIISYTNGAVFTYSYRSTEIVSPNQVEVLQAKDFDNDGEVDNVLTLTACHPKYSARERIVVRARLSEAPAPAPSVDPDRPTRITFEDDNGEGPPVSRTPAILWGLAAGMIWLAAYFVGSAWRKRPSYIIGFPFFMVALYIFFESFYALLPAGF